MKFLLLWLEGPLQSWGYDSRFDTRKTFDFPTKSGIYGLLLASSGDSGPQCELLERMKDTFFLAISCVPQNSDPQKSGDYQLLDYHMVGNGYDENNEWESLHILRKQDGKVAKISGRPSTKQTYRYYLQNKKFAVILGFEDDLAEKFAASLQAPVFDLYLGRKCCVPTDFIFRDIFDSKEEAWTAMEKLAEDKKLKPDKKLIEVDPANAGSLHKDVRFLSDVPLEFGLHKRYTDRCVQIVKCE
ncbi:MAG: type I-E CRISPR-associated protein Cas5/CasD [Thermoguttaceae bacterium]|nr:type I-E CRISPR-associated protein Cas5/CasD [Thermoguttaceae bacterium]